MRTRPSNDEKLRPDDGRQLAGLCNHPMEVAPDRVRFAYNLT